MRYLFHGVIIWLLSISCIFASPQTKIHSYHLSNGLALYVIEDHRAPAVLSSIWYNVGGSYEPNGITGVSHLLEHLMFRGSKNFPNDEIKKQVMQAGGQQNAMTSPDYTMYYQLLPASQLTLSLHLEADRMRHLILKQDEFNQEKKVVMEERRLRIEDKPQALAWVRFRAAAFINNPYHQPTIGWHDDIQQLTLPETQQWYNTWYAPNNAF